MMEHEDGHQIKIAHGGLSRENRKALEKLPHVGRYAEGTTNVQPDRKPASVDTSHLDPADAGVAKSESKISPETRKAFKNPFAMAEGGNVSDVMKRKASVDEYNKTHEDEPKEYDQDTEALMQRTDVTPKQRFADGGDIDYDKLIPQEQAQQQPYMLPADQAKASPLPPAPTDGAVAQDAPAPQATAQPSEPQQAQAAPQVNPVDMPKVPAASSDDPSIMHGYGEQTAGIQNMAAAESQQANATAATLKGHLLGVEKTMADYQKHYNELDSERKAFQQDILDKHIDPNRYLGSMDTTQRIGTAIGLALGGLGGAINGGGNQALDFINKQIDRDIASQHADIDKKETLLNANMRQFGNLKDATDMTKLMMADQVKTQLGVAEARAQSPIAKAKAQELLGQLEQQVAPVAQQFAMRRMLQSPSTDLSSQDPSTYVKSLVPPDRQKDVFGEIERAQNTGKMGTEIMKKFDDVVKDYQGEGGLGRVGGMLRENRNLQNLKGLVNTTVTDLTGTARQAEFDSVANNMLPKPGDTDKELSDRRSNFLNYLNAKSAAPTAKGYGIDLEKFKSTTHDPISKLSPQQQEWAKYAKANNDTVMLKKLGLQ